MATEAQWWCYGIGQGAKLAASSSEFERGMHTEGIRRAMIGILRQRRKDDPALVQTIVDALAANGIDLDLDAVPNETGKP